MLEFCAFKKMKEFILMLLLCGRLVMASLTFYTYNESPCTSEFLCAISHDQEEVVKMMIDNNSEILNTKIAGGLPIHFAARLNKENMVKILIDHKPEMANWKDDEGYTPLFHVVEEDGSENLVNYLIGKGSDVNTQDEYNRTPLHICAKTGNENIAKLLIENNANVNAQTSYSNTPLHASAIYGTVNIAKLLIAHGADYNAKGFNGDTPLHVAAMNGNKDVAALLMSIEAVDINARNRVFQSPCDVVLQKDHETLWPILKCAA